MKDKEKLIEEMASILGNGCAIPCSKWKYADDCGELEGAMRLYNANCRIVKKDSVVLSKDEYGSKLQDAYDNGVEFGKEWSSKETAEKFADLLFSHITTREVWEELRALWLHIGGGKKANLHIWNLLIEPVAKQFGVEIKE